jgi:hypothetical protein
MRKSQRLIDRIGSMLSSHGRQSHQPGPRLKPGLVSRVRHLKGRAKLLQHAMLREIREDK